MLNTSMWIKSVFFLSAATLMGITLSAQPEREHQPFSAHGEIPREFLTSSTYKYLNSKEGIPRKNKRYVRKAKEEFYLQSSFATDELLLSGKVLFNDSLSQFLEKVADILLADQPELRQELRFYALKSPLPNAFATQRGAIFVNLGLVARLENEAQLAYILAHEIAHYVKGHIMQRYVNDRHIQRLWRHAQPGFTGARRMLQSNFTQDSETEADLMGLDMVKATDYDLARVPQVFAMLRRADQPLPGKAPSLSLLASPFLPAIHQWPASSLPTSKAMPIDSQLIHPPTYLSTHPQPQLREQLIEHHLPETVRGEAFLVSNEAFQDLQLRATNELLSLYLGQAAFFDALHQLLSRPPLQTAHERMSLCKALYGIAKYKQAQKPIQPLLDYRQATAASHELIGFVEQLSAEEALALALAHSWEQSLKEPGETYYSLVIDDLLLDLKHRQDSLAWNFERHPMYQPLWEQQALRDRFNAISLPRLEERARQKPKPKAGQSPPYRLGIDSVVVFNPRYNRIDERPKQGGIQYITSERQQSMLDSYILSSGQEINLSVTLLDSKFISPDYDAEHFNDIALLADWHQEKLIHGEVEMVCSNYEQVAPLMDKYGTPYFVHMGAISLRSPIEMNQRLKWLALLVAPPLWPYGIYEMVKPHEASIFYSLVYDLNTGKRIAVISDMDRAKVKDKALYSHIHRALRQMKLDP